MKCTLMPGIKSVSGAMKIANGRQMVFKTFQRKAADGTYKKETRVYLQPKIQRSTPLSENQIAARNRFSEAATYFKNLSNEQRKQYFDEWVRSNLFFNGKWYATLRGYIMARFYANDLAN